MNNSTFVKKVCQKLSRLLLAATLLAAVATGFSPGVVRAGAVSSPGSEVNQVASPTPDPNDSQVVDAVYGGTGSVESSVYGLIDQEANLLALARSLAVQGDKSDLATVLQKITYTRNELESIIHEKLMNHTTPSPSTQKTSALMVVPLAQASVLKGSGTKADPYLIYTAQDLNYIRYTATDTAYYKLMNNIDLSIYDESYDGGAGWSPIGDNNNQFNGNFDGNGYAISDLYINSPLPYIGLFGYTSSSAEIRNTVLDNVYVAGSKSSDNVGALVGFNSGSVNNSYVKSGSIFEKSTGFGFNNVGGLIGVNSGSITDSYANTSLSDFAAADGIGGLVGGNTGIIVNSHSDAIISGSGGYTSIGGLVGGNGGSITDSYANVNAPDSGGYDNLGGLAGSSGGSISRSYTTGKLSNSGMVTYVGGLVGDSSADITNSYATANVSTSGFIDFLGGLVGGGYGGSVTDSFAAGQVANYGFWCFTGGLVGLNSNTSLTDSYWDIDTTGKTNATASGSAGDSAGNGKHTAQMKEQATFVGWDFVNTWGIDEGKSYPYLLTGNNGQQLLQILAFILGKSPNDFFGNDPVSLTTGNFIQESTDLKIPTRGVPLAFTRFYNSTDTYSGPLGHGWTDNYNSFLTLNSDGSISVKYGDGHVAVFTANGTSYSPPAGCFEKLTAGPNKTYILTFKDQTRYTYNSSGQLISESARNGNTNTLNYTNGLLSSVSGPAGRSLNFTYGSQNQLTAVADSVSRAVYFTYDQSGNLAAVRDVRGGVTKYGYDSNGLTDVTDPDGHNVVHNDYDSHGRVVSQADGKGNVTKFAYDPTNHRTVMTDQRGNSATFTYNDDYRITQINYPGNVSESYTYDANWDRASVTDKDGHTTNCTYDANGNLLTQTDPAPLNYTTTYSYDSLNDPVSIVDAAGHTTTFSYDADGNPLSVTRQIYGGTAITSFAYNQYGQITGSTDADGHTTKYGYDQYGNLASVTGPLGHTTTYTHDAAGRLLGKTDALGHTTAYTYDPAGNLLSVTDPLGNRTVYTYDPAGNRLSMTDPRGNVTRFAYDSDNKLISKTDPLDGMTTYDYDAENNLVSVTDAVYHTTTYTYDFLDRLTSTTDPDGHTQTYSLDGNGNRVAVTDRNGNTTTYAYDVLNRPVTVTDALGNKTVFQYDPLGNRTAVTDPRGYTTKYTYDPASRLVSQTDPLGHTTGYTYDPAGNQTSLTNPLGAKWAYAYDDDNRLVSVTDPLGHMTKTAYDSTGNVVSSTDADGNTTRFGYNAINELGSVTDALGHTTKYVYDRDGNLVRVTNARGYSGTLKYDADNRLVKETDPLDLATGMSYDAVGNMVRKTQPDGTAINYAYDADNQLTGINYPDQGGVTYAFDPDGNRTSMTDPGGTTSYQYNPLGQLTQVDENGGNVGYTYDRAGNITGITYPNGLQASYAYNGLNQPVSVSDGVYAASISYDPAGQRTGEMLPNGVNVTYAYDPAGQLTVVQSASGDKTIAKAAYTLDNVGNRLSMTDEKDQTTRYTYNSDYELTGVRYPNGRQDEYTYDPVGNRTSENRTRYVYDPDNHLVMAGHDPYLYDQNGNMVFGNKTLYLYDNENRLNNVLTFDGFKDIQYAYDGDGNRTSRSVSNIFDLGGSTRNELNREMSHLLVPQTGRSDWSNLLAPGQLRKWVDSPAGMKKQDDGLPGILQGSGLPGRLPGQGVSARRGSVAVNVYEEYIYDFNAGLPHLAAEKDSDGNITDYLYDGHLYEAIVPQPSGHHEEEPGVTSGGEIDSQSFGHQGIEDLGSMTGNLHGAGAGSQLPGFGPGNPGGWWPKPPGIPGGRIFYQQDGLGSVSAITNINGQVLQRYSYDAFGEPRIQGKPVPNPFMFTGEPYDQADGLLYLGARYYDPEIGRFLTQDSFFGRLADPLSQNGYVYGGNNPVLNVDPSGHVTVCFQAWFYTTEALNGSYEIPQENVNDLYQYWSSLPKAIQEEKAILSGNGNFLQKLNAQAALDQYDIEEEVLNQLLIYNGSGYQQIDKVVALQTLQQLSKEQFNQVFGMIAGSTGAIEVIGEDLGTAVIGKMEDLNKPGAIRPGEFKVADLLPNQGEPQANWQQNSSVLRKIMGWMRPIRDASIDPVTGKPEKNTGFLRAERNLLQNLGWSYNASTGYWYPPQ